MDKNLTSLIEKLKKIFDARLVSVVLYGSAASGEFQQQYSDYNIFCVLTEITPDELRDAEPIFRWWSELGSPPPLLMAEHEVAGSTDCFPIEYQDMQERRKVLYGKDVVADLTIDRSFYRAQVEYELRSKLLRLRQKAAGVLQDQALLMRLMADSVSTFLVLGRHALILSGVPCEPVRRATVSKMAERFQIAAGPFTQLLDVREDKIKPRSLDAVALFAEYLKGVQALVDAVDGLQK